MIRALMRSWERQRPERPTSASRKRFVLDHVGEELVASDRIATPPRATMTAAPQALDHKLRESVEASLTLLREN